jgi:hypothetical protein
MVAQLLQDKCSRIKSHIILNEVHLTAVLDLPLLLLLLPCACAASLPHSPQLPSVAGTLLLRHLVHL